MQIECLRIELISSLLTDIRILDQTHISAGLGAVTEVINHSLPLPKFIKANKAVVGVDISPKYAFYAMCFILMKLQCCQDFKMLEHISHGKYPIFC